MSTDDNDGNATVDFTDETYKRAWRLAALATRAGAHRRELMRAMGLGVAPYRRALECAVAEGWAVVRGHGTAARVVDARDPELVATSNGTPPGRSAVRREERG